MGVFWPCPASIIRARRGSGKTANSKRRMAKRTSSPSRYRDPGEVTDTEYPVILTTGRVVSQYLSGTQTRRIGRLVDQYPEPLLEIHPKLAAQYGITDRELVRVVSRRGSAEFPAQLVETIREDTVFVPYHWAGKQSINQLTSGHLDPVSKIPEFKVSAVRSGATGKRAPSAETKQPSTERRLARTPQPETSSGS